MKKSHKRIYKSTPTSNSFYKIVEYVGYVIFLISDYLIQFVSGILSVNLIEKTPFPRKFMTYGILVVRIIAIMYGYRLLFLLIFNNFMKDVFTRSTTSQCMGSVVNAGMDGWDGKPLCQTAIYAGENYLNGAKTTIQYDFTRMSKASSVAIKQLMYWILCLNLFAIPATLKSV